MAKVITIENRKGGVGKTTTTAGIGAGLYQEGYRVLLIDADPQANLSSHFGYSTEENGNLFDSLVEGKELSIKKSTDAPDIVCSHLNLINADILLANEPGREIILRNLLAPIQDQYDYILIDCPPALGILTLNALSCSHLVIIPIEPGKFSIDGIKRLLETIQKVRDRINNGLKGYRIIITKFDARKKVQKDTVLSLQRTFADRIFETIIRMNATVEYAQAAGVDIYRQDPTSKVAIEYLQASKELIKMLD